MSSNCRSFIPFCETNDLYWLFLHCLLLNVTALTVCQQCNTKGKTKTRGVLHITDTDIQLLVVQFLRGFIIHQQKPTAGVHLQTCNSPFCKTVTESR